MNKNTLYRFLSGKATQDEIAEIKVWIESAEENKRKYLQERRLLDAVLLNSGEETVMKPRKKLFSQYSMRIVAILACAILLLSGGLIAYQNVLVNKDMCVFNTVHVPAGQRTNVILSDGTSVWLNAGTTLQYPATFTKDHREVTIDGEGYFEVVHDETSPFIVHTYLMNIQVLGTTFDVKALAASNEFETSLIDGRVKVYSPAKEGEEYYLSPKQRLTYRDDSFQTSHIVDANTFLWREGIYSFNQMPLDSILRDLERYYGVRIDQQNNEIRKVTLSGKFRIGDGIEYALCVLQHRVEFDYQILPGTQEIIIR